MGSRRPLPPLSRFPVHLAECPAAIGNAQLDPVADRADLDRHRTAIGDGIVDQIAQGAAQLAGMVSPEATALFFASRRWSAQSISEPDCWYSDK